MVLVIQRAHFLARLALEAGTIRKMFTLRQRYKNLVVGFRIKEHFKQYKI